MLRYEIKKILSKPVNKIVILALAVVTVIASALTIRDVKYITENGDTVSGLRAARYLKEEKNQWKGLLTKEVFQKVVEENQKIKSTEAEDKAFADTQQFADIREIINLAFSGFDEYDYYKAENVSAKEAAGLYEKRVASLKEWLESEEVKHTFSEKEKAFLISQYEKLETPFYYEYADGWKALLDSQYLPTLTLILVLVSAFLVAGIFSDEFQLKADAIFFSSRFGRNRAVVSKIGAGFCIITGVYWAVMLLFSIIVLGVLGTGGARCAVQTGLSNWNSIYNLTYLQDYFLTMIGGYIGSLFILTLSMFVSAKSHSTVFAITVPFALVCVPPFLGKIAVLSRGMSLFPDKLLSISKSLEDFSLYQLGGKVMGAVTVLVPLYLVLYFVILPVLYRVYKKAQVK